MEDALAQAEAAQKKGKPEEVQGFTNMFPQLNLSRNCMILIVVLLFVFLFKDEIMKNKVVKSITKSLSLK